MDTAGSAKPAEVVAAFEMFYRDNVLRLVAFLRWYGAPWPDAADCVQDTLAECYIPCELPAAVDRCLLGGLLVYYSPSC